MLANKFYFDEFDEWLIRWSQEIWSPGFRWFDRWILDLASFRARHKQGNGATGYVLRFLQVETCRPTRSSSAQASWR